jgi:hypothetical protein
MLLLTFPAYAQSDSEKIDQMRKLADQYKIAIEERYGRGIVLRLPDNIDTLPGLHVTKESGKNVILPSGDAQYVRCIRTAIETMGLTSAAGAAGGAPGFLLGVNIAAVQAGRDASNCAVENTQRLFEALSGLEATDRAKGLTVQIDSFSKELEGLQGELTDVKSAILALQFSMKQDMQQTLAALMEKAVTKQDVEQIVTSEMRSMQENTRKYFAELREHQATAAKMEKAKADIEVAQQGLTSFVGIVFRKNPTLANKINRGVMGAAQIAQIGIAMSVASPFGAVMLSLTAMGVMDSMFGSSADAGAIFNQAVLENIQELKHDISILGGEMHARFDAVERSLAVMADYMRKGFIVMDGKLDALRTALGEMREEADVKDRLLASSLGYLLSGQFNISAQRCLQGLAAASLNLHDYGNCLGDFKLYATDVARLDMIAGSGRIANDPLGNVTANFYISIDTGKMLGYLSTLDRKIKNSPAAGDAPSPLEWVRGVEAYLALLDKYDTLEAVRSTRSKHDSISEEQNNIESMIDAGQQIKHVAQHLRRDGAVAVIGLYIAEMQKFSDLLAKAVIDDLATRPLGVTRDITWRREWVEQTRYSSSWFRPCADINRGVGGIPDVIANDGDRLSIEYASQCWRDMFTNKDTDGPAKESALAFAKSVSEGQFSFGAKMSHDEAVKNLQTLYLKREPTEKYSRQVNDSIRLSLEEMVQKPEAQQFLGRLQLLQNLVLQCLLIGADNASDPQLQANIQLVQSLATTPAQLNTLLSRVTFKSSKPLSDVFAIEANKIFAAEQTRVVDVLKTTQPKDSFPFVDRPLALLGALVLH